MQNTTFPSALNDEINAIETELKNCLDWDSPIDTVKLKRLCHLREDRLKELASTHQQRLDIMKSETRKMTAQLVGLDLELRPEIKQKLLDEQDKYDLAASHWVISENSLWGESEAASIAAGIMILANEVR